MIVIVIASFTTPLVLCRWSYGVTLWEIMAEGKKPYENIETKNLAHELDCGHRMKKPEHCSDAV